jgi:vancomycin resistance protein YoaR
MSNTDRQTNPYSTAVSRRRFLRTAAWGGAALGVAGLGGLGFSARASEKPGGSGAVAENTASGQRDEASRENSKEQTSGKDRQKIGEYRTDYRYSDNPARKYNLRLSAQAVDGTVLEPGQVFSMNDHVEPLDYKKAKVFADGGETVADGGGLCQSTSTIYMAAHYAGLEIVERNPHYTTLPYIRPGFDATVWFGYGGTEELDMKLKNNMDSDVEIREYVTDDGFLVAEIWGQPTGKEVTMRSEQDFRDLDRGIKWSTYKTVKQDGEVVRQGLLHEDLYSFPPPTEGGSYNDVRTGGW